MKKLYALLLFICPVILNVSGQNILSFTVTPANPTPADPIMVVVACEFTTGSCDGVAMLNGINGNEIQAIGSHCVGMLQVICDDNDTIMLPPLPSGQYNFIFNLLTGSGFPCTPGSIPVIDSVTITVTGTSGLGEIKNNSMFSIMPNPTSGSFEIGKQIKENSFLKVFSPDGKLVQSLTLKQSQTKIDLTLADGIYMVLIENNTERYYSRLQVIN